MELPGKTAILIGGAGPGTGQALTRRFAREGCRVLVADNDEERGWPLLDELRAEGRDVAFFLADIGSEESTRELFRVAEQRFGGVDILIHSASAPYRPGEVFRNWKEIVEVDVLGALHAATSAIEMMEERGGGAIVFFSSTSALGHGRKHSGSPVYDFVKAAVLRLTTVLAPVCAKSNVRVNCMVPDWVATPEVKEFWDPLTPAERAWAGAPQQLTPPDEIAQAVVQLVTDDNLNGRALVWWSDEQPGLIPAGDPGYGSLEPYTVQVK